MHSVVTTAKDARHCLAASHEATPCGMGAVFAEGPVVRPSIERSGSGDAWGWVSVTVAEQPAKSHGSFTTVSGARHGGAACAAGDADQTPPLVIPRPVVAGTGSWSGQPTSGCADGVSYAERTSNEAGRRAQDSAEREGSDHPRTATIPDFAAARVRGWANYLADHGAGVARA